MAFTSGFFNSLYSDRFYDAKQMAQLFDGLILDGVYAHVGEKLFVEAQEGDYVVVGTGRAWFNHTWSLNDTPMIIALEPANALERYDAIVLEVDHRDEVRQNSIKVVKGTAATSNPKKPTMEKSDYVFQYPLAYIHRAKNATEVTQSDIENRVGTFECPFATGILKGGNIEGVYAQLQDQFNRWWEQIKDIIEDENIPDLTLLGMLDDSKASILDLRKRIYRGYDLGDHVTEEQLESIRSGNFTNLYIGDYWNINGVKFVIADIDYYYNLKRHGCPYTPVNQHHLVIVSKPTLDAFLIDKSESIQPYYKEYIYPEFNTENILQSDFLEDVKNYNGTSILMQKIDSIAGSVKTYYPKPSDLENPDESYARSEFVIYNVGYSTSVRPVIKKYMKPYIEDIFGSMNLISYPDIVIHNASDYIWDYCDVEEMEPFVGPFAVTTAITDLFDREKTVFKNKYATNSSGPTTSFDSSNNVIVENVYNKISKNQAVNYYKLFELKPDLGSQHKMNIYLPEQHYLINVYHSQAITPYSIFDSIPKGFNPFVTLSDGRVYGMAYSFEHSFYTKSAGVTYGGWLVNNLDVTSCYFSPVGALNSTTIRFLLG